MVIDDLINDPDYLVHEETLESNYKTTGKELSHLL